MLGSADSIGCANIMLNTAVAEELRQFADELENAEDFHDALDSLIKRTIKEHKRIIFNGNGYDDAWIKEATEKRGLLNLRTTPDALPHYIKQKNLDLFKAHKIYSDVEVFSRYEILLENYCKVINIEATTMIDMASKDLLPAMSNYTKVLCDTLISKKNACPTLPCTYEEKTASRMATLTDEAYEHLLLLKEEISKISDISDTLELAEYYRDTVITRMQSLRSVVDEAETITSKEYWPYPSYGDMLFSVK